MTTGKRCASALWCGMMLGIGAGETEAQLVERVQPGVISSAANENFPMIDPLDGSLWFSRYERGFNDQTIWRAPLQGETWGAPEVVPFSGEWGNIS